MSEPSNGAWPFQEIPEEEGLDISAIFGDSSAAPQGDPFAPPAAAQSVPSSPTPVAQEITPAVAATSQPTTAPIAKAPVEAPAENPIAAAFEQKTAENTKKGLLEKPPVFYHKGVKEEIDDPSMTFEELRIRKSDDFTDLEEGKRVSWSVEYCGIRKEVKDPKGTTIISMKEMIERSREFLDALKKTKDKAPCCYVKPKVEMKTKGNAAYKGKFGTLEEARNSDKVICLIPSNDGRIYELRKMEQGEFIAPKKNVVDFSEVRAGFSPALPKIPAELMGQIIAFFRAFMTDHGENEAFAQIYWDKAEKRFFAYVPKQSVCKEEVEADLHDCLYDDEERYLCYADIHSHNSMDAFFSGKDDQDERSTGLYLVLGKLDKFYPDVKARIFCGDSFVSIDPNIVMEGLEQPFPKEWLTQVSIRSRKSERFKKPDKGGYNMSIKSQEGHMRQLALLLTTDLGCIFGERESGPNGSKKAFLNVGKVFLRALAKDLGLHEVTVSANSGGIAVSGTCSLYGMWEDRGIAVWIEQRLCADGKVLCYRTIRSSRDFKGGYNHFLTSSDLKTWSYPQLLETLSALRKDGCRYERAA